MPSYIANFAFTRPESALRPKDQMHGIGAIRIQTDKVPETNEDFQEIAKVIFRSNPGQYATVGVESLEPTDTFIDDSDTILEGFVTND